MFKIANAFVRWAGQQIRRTRVEETPDIRATFESDCGDRKAAKKKPNIAITCIYTLAHAGGGGGNGCVYA